MKRSMKAIFAAMAAAMAVSAMAVSASAECVSDNTNQDEGGFTAFCGAIMLDDTSAAEAPAEEAAAATENASATEDSTDEAAAESENTTATEASTDEAAAEPENTSATEASTVEVHIPLSPYTCTISANAFAEASADEAAAVSENATATEENKNEDNPDELREEDKSERTKDLEIVSKALNPIKEKTGVDDKVVDTMVDKLNDVFVKNTGDELPKEDKIFFTETGKIVYNTLEGTFMGEIVPGIGGYRAMVKFNELMSKAQDAKTPELRDKYLKEAQRCCREGIVKCIPGGSIVLTGTELVLSTTKYAINKTFGTDLDFDVNPLHWELPEHPQNINEKINGILECGKIKDMPQNQDVANIKEYIKNMRSGF